MLGFAGGVMLVVVFVELIPEGLETGFAYPVLGLLLGVLSLLFLDEHFAHHHFVSKEDHHHREKYLKKGVLIATGVALHNFPEGLAIGAGFVASPALGITLTILIALHNLPEGLAAGIPLKTGGSRPLRIILTTVAAGLPMGVGAMVGALLGTLSPFMLGGSLGFAAGAMLYIISDELIPDVYRLTNPHVAIGGITAGVIIGIVMIHFI